MSKKRELVLCYTTDGSYGVCPRHEVVLITLHDITEDEHDEIDAADEHDLVNVLDKISFRIINDDMKEFYND